jgi:hypothetical protein
MTIQERAAITLSVLLLQCLPYFRRARAARLQGLTGTPGRSAMPSALIEDRLDCRGITWILNSYISTCSLEPGLEDRAGGEWRLGKASCAKNNFRRPRPGFSLSNSDHWCYLVHNMTNSLARLIEEICDFTQAQTTKTLCFSVLFSIALLALPVIARRTANEHQERRPPRVPYLIPWIGSALSVGANPDAFLARAV